MKDYSLLIVEDNSADMLLLKEFLAKTSKSNYKLHGSSTLADTLKLCAHYEFDAILLDLSLPDSAGIDTVRKVIAANPETPVIVLTELREEGIGLQAVRYGAQDFLAKRTLSPETLCHSLRYVIEKKKALDEKIDLLQDLHQALERITLLENVLPLCLGCGKLLCSDGQWRSLNTMENKQPTSRHGFVVCPACQQSRSSSAE